jgi:hypothetical protein
MDVAHATDAIHQVLRQIQSNQGFDCPTLTDAIKPIKDLQKFDSPTSLAATGMVARKLGLKIDPKINIFGDKKGLHTIGQSVALLCDIANAKTRESAKA